MTNEPGPGGIDLRLPDGMHPQTTSVHVGNEPDPATGAVAPPLHLSSTFRHAADGTLVAGYDYQRAADPTNDRLCAALAALEGGAVAYTFASGMAAIAGLLEALPPDARLLMPSDCYVGLRMYATQVLATRGARVEWVDMTDLEAVRAACTDAADLVWIETPSNPMLKLTDIQGIVRIARGCGARVACDNTFATPLLQQPLALGVDVVMHSATKYFGGHSDVLGGALVFAGDDALSQAVATRRHLAGAILSPFNAWLVLRGLRSLPARMAMHCANARQVAAFLASRPEVERVNYPGLATHPGHAIAASQMRDFGGMLSVQLRGGRDAALRMASRLRVFTNATSLGGCESLVEHRASIEGPTSPTPGNLLRMSVGVEHVDDLIADLEQALA